MTIETISIILFCYVVFIFLTIPLLCQLSKFLLGSENVKNQKAKIMGNFMLYMNIAMVYTTIIARLAQ